MAQNRRRDRTAIVALASDVVSTWDAGAFVGATRFAYYSAPEAQNEARVSSCRWVVFEGLARKPSIA